MKLRILLLPAVALLATGCLQFREQIGASAGTDHDVLTGGPLSGTTLADLPAPVRDALLDRAPHGEVADIDKTSHDGKVIYQIAFVKPGVNPRIFVAEDGRWVSSPAHLERIIASQSADDQASVGASD